jgi:uncharacterized SAM-binding protein YcdF (DUF218 family)
VISARQWADAQVLWDYQLMRHALQPCDAAVVFGSHDLGVAVRAVELWRAGLFPVAVFTGGNSPTTRERFPRGEAVHYREHAVRAGMPDHAILVEPRASNTGENLTLSRAVLEAAGIAVGRVLAVCKPYMERRVWASARAVWPQVEVVCASERVTLERYVRGIGDARLVVDMIVGDVERVIAYPARGFAVEQVMPEAVRAAYGRLRADGFVSRCVTR